jgi:D-threo-aldose 1-dehydrogenase
MTSPAGLPRLGLGTGTFDAGLPSKTARATVERAWELGVRLFDTAPFYGSGLGEQRLGEALSRRARDDYFLSTKVGRILTPDGPVFDFGPEGVRRSFAGSLERLGVERVDLILLHDPEEHLDSARRALETARQLAPQVGVGTNAVSTALTLVERGEVDVVLLAGRYTLLDRSAGEELLPLCADRRIPVLAAGVFNSGVLAGGSTFDYHAAPSAVVGRRDLLAAVCSRHGVPLAAAALQFPLHHPAVDTVLVGARSPEEIEEDVHLLTTPVPDELWAELDVVHAFPPERPPSTKSPAPITKRDSSDAR